MNETKHTPTPWTANKRSIRAGKQAIASVHRINGLPDNHPIILGNAAFIVLAANCHDELVHVCRYLVDGYPGNQVARLGNGTARKAYDLAVAALAHAGE